MTLELQKLKNRIPEIDSIEYYKKYSILLPIIEYKNDMYILFEVRSEMLRRQPSEICFPGGRIEADETYEEAAVRETCEELLIDENMIMVLGELDTVITPFNTIIYPFAGIISEYNNTFNASEVKDVFIVPISYFLNNEPIFDLIDVTLQPKPDFHYHMIQKGEKYPWAKGSYPVYFYQYNEHVIWGITARIIKNFIDIFKTQKDRE